MIDYVRGGGGSGATNVDYTHNILQGMQIKEEEGKVTLYQPLVDFYMEQVSEKGIKNDANITVTDDMLNAAAENADTAIVTIGRYSSEGSDRSASKGDYYLSDAETELLTRVAAKFKKTVVVLNVGAVLDTEWIKDIPGIDSVLMAWQAGMEGGLATADVLVGDVNPSGKFVDTFAKDYKDYPSSNTFYESNSYVNYEEDVFVGYRFFETFDPEYTKVNYDFGYGLSSENQISDWMIMQYNNLTGSVLTCYIFGMLCAKMQLFTKVKESSFIQKGKNPVVLLVMLTISIITYCLQKALIMPFYGLAVFVLFNLWEKGKIAEKIWLFLGKHSTNIWLTHMFFYLYIFIGAIQRLQYPVLMFGGMIAVCVAVSVVILKLHEIICDRKGKNRSFAWN